MTEAFKILGISSYHGLTLIANASRDSEPWCRALDAKFHGKGAHFTGEDWDSLLGEYSAVSDVPAICFAEELMAIYPEAKVVLVERDLSSWERSFDEGIIKNAWSPVIDIIARLDQRLVGPVHRVLQRWRGAWMGVENEEGMRRRAVEKYREHYAMVEEIAGPQGRLLKFRLGEGWGPLCEFLGKKVPGVEFPRVNDSEALKETVALILRQGIYNFLGDVGKIGLGILVAGLGIYLWKYRW